MISIYLNGEQKQVAVQSSIASVVAGMGLNGKRYAVEVNKEIVPKSEHAEYSLKQGDCVEVVQAIGGG